MVSYQLLILSFLFYLLHVQKYFQKVLHLLLKNRTYFNLTFLIFKLLFLIWNNNPYYYNFNTYIGTLKGLLWERKNLQVFHFFKTLAGLFSIFYFIVNCSMITSKFLFMPTALILPQICLTTSIFSSKSSAISSTVFPLFIFLYTISISFLRSPNLMP